MASFRNVEDETIMMLNDAEDTENITDDYILKKHDILEAEEKVKFIALGPNKCIHQNHHVSTADSSDANIPDPISLYNNQDNVFIALNFNVIRGSSSSACPLATPNSAVKPDGSQTSFGNGSTARSEERKASQNHEESSGTSAIDFDQVPPFERLQYPLADDIYEKLLAESNHNWEILNMPSNTSSFSAFPISSSSSTSTVEDKVDDVTDPESIGK